MSNFNIPSIKPPTYDLTPFNAVTECISKEYLLISENIIFIILMILFYFTTHHAYNLIEKSKDIHCKINIKQSEYDDFISAFIYWIISFIIIIIIKYNDLNIINKFVWTTKKNALTNVATKESNEKWNRLYNVGNLSVSTFTSILNIVYIFVMLYVSYKIIDKLIELIHCKSVICSRSDLCKLPDSKYYDTISKQCLNEEKKPSGKESEESEESEIYDEDILRYDMIPKWIRELINKWTNTAAITVTIAVLFVTGIVYVWFGWKNIDGVRYLNLLSLLITESILFAGINISLLVYYMGDEGDIRNKKKYDIYLRHLAKGLPANWSFSKSLS